MFRRIIFIVLALFAVLGCEDHSYRGQMDIILSERGSYPVSIKLGDADEDVLTKGCGIREGRDPDVWKNAEIYIYAFSRDMLAPYSVTREMDRKICLIDASTEASGSKAGKKAKVNSDSFISWTSNYDNVIYYPNMNRPFEFFAYYLDDVVVPDEQIERSESSIKMPVTINGTQDLMTATASLTEKQLEPYKDDKFALADIQNHAYSSYTAQKNISPALQFRHHLVRLDFELHSAKKGADSLYVDSLVVMSRNEGVFTVVDKATSNMGVDFSADETYERMLLTEKGGKVLRTYDDNPDSAYHAPPYDPFITETKGTHVGGSMLVAPDTEYEARVYATQVKNGRVFPDQVYDIQIKYRKEDHFGPGNQYIVKLRVSGLMDIEVDVELGNWESGGDIIIDNEDIPE